MACLGLASRSLLWIVTLGIVQITVRSIPSDQEYCHYETFNATCRADEVILMRKALYGRMRFGRCMKEDHGSVGCNGDALPHFDRVCSGLHTCQVVLPDPALHNIHPCPKELFPYLEADYACVKVKTGNYHSCNMFGGQRLTGDSGYLASITPGESPAGTKNCPWKIQVERGQTINLTLVHFGTPGTAVAGKKGGPGDKRLENVCTTFVVIKEGSPAAVQELPVCKTGERERVVHLSHASEMSVYVDKRAGSQASNPRFLLKYQAIGCPDVTGIPNAVITRKEDTTIVKCNFTGETFFLSCSNSRWKGELNNCTRAVPWGTSKKVDPTGRFPYGLLIVIGIGVALGVALGIILLFGILFCLRKRKEERLRSHTTDPLLSQSDTQIESEENHSNLYASRKECGSIAGTLTRERALQLQKAQTYIMNAADLHQQLNSAHHAAQAQGLLYPHSHSAAEIPATLPLVVGEGQQLIACNHIECCSPDGAAPGHVAHAQRRLSYPSDLVDHHQTQQTSFITFKPDPESAYGRMSRTLERGASLDLIKDSEPATYRQLQPDHLVVECSCTLRHGPGQGPDCTRSLPRGGGAGTTTNNTSV